MGIPGSANPMLLAGAAGAYQINQSLRFNSADSTYLYRTFGSGDRNNWTLSVWVKRAGNLAAADCDIFFGYDGSSSSLGLVEFNSGPVNHDQGGTGNGRAETSATLRDPSAWYHIVVSVDYGNATAANRVRIFVNGVQQTLGVNTVTTNDGQINGAWQHRIGARSSSTFDGYMAEMHFIGGTTVTSASDFGETDTITGAWIPKKYSGSYGTNGFYLKFDPSATNGIGHDHSGNGNNWTASGFSTSGTGTDVMSDTPTTNWCTFNPLVPGASNFSDGNLVVTANSSGSANRGTPFPTFQLPTSGKWYAEFTPSSIGEMQIGLVQGSATIGDTVAGYYRAGTVSVEGTGTVETVASFTNGDVIGVIVNADEQKIRFSKNGTIVTTQEWSYSSAPSSANSYLSFKQGSSSGSCRATANFGQRAFAYTPPTGYKALNTANLPEPTIKKGSAHFNTVLYTGNGSTQSITGVGFQPDWIWCKSRNSSSSHTLTDAVRGADRQLWSNLTTSEQTNSTDFITSFNSDGFTSGPSLSGTGDTNSSGVTFVAWNWKANGAGSSNTAGTITSTVSANASAGFSIATYTGTGSNASVGHGLGVTPSMCIIKQRNTAQNWWVWHQALGNNVGANNTMLELNGTAGTYAADDVFRGFTSTVFQIGTDSGSNTNGGTYVAYCFSEVAGYSKFGSYTGNSSSDGTFVYCGFRPRWILFKNTSNSIATHWVMADSQRSEYNAVDDVLYASLANAETAPFGSTGYVDFLSNGFKLRYNWDYVNSGYTYIFAAFAELPFKYANAR